MGICQANRKSQIVRVEHCLCIEVSVPNGLNIFPTIQSLKKKKKKRKIGKMKGSGEREGEGKNLVLKTEEHGQNFFFK